VVDEHDRGAPGESRDVVDASLHTRMQRLQDSNVDRRLRATPASLRLAPEQHHDTKAGVLPGQADDQALYLLVQRRPAGLAVRLGPRAGDQPSMPPQRLRSNEEARPAGSRQDAADGGEQGPVGGSELGPRRLAAQQGELVAQDEDLEVVSASPRASWARSWMERHSSR